MLIHNLEVLGQVLDKQTRCSHYHSERDIIAIKFKCCNTYYPCYQCHKEVADHPIEVWKADEYHKKAILCGVCGFELTIETYMNSNNQCPECNAHFNPGCQLHHHLYFETKKA